MKWKTLLSRLALSMGAVGANAQSNDCAFSARVLGSDGEQLTLVGAGVRSYWFRSINAVALYYHRKVSDWDEIAGSERDARADVVFFVERFSGEELRASWRERFGAILDPSQLATYASSIDSLMGLFVDAERGDKLSFASSRQGLTLSLNGKLLGQVGDLSFGRTVLSSWFGDNPASAALKAAVFRGGTVENLPCTK